MVGAYEIRKHIGIDTSDSSNQLNESPITPPVVPPRRDLKPTVSRRPNSIRHSITRPLSSFFGSNYSESNRGSMVGSIGSHDGSLNNSPVTPSVKQNRLNLILDPSPPPLMTKEQSRNEIAMVRNALRQNAYSRVIYK